MEQLDDLITLREASKISGYNPDYLGYVIRSGKMRGRKVGRNWMTTKEDVKYYLAHSSVLSKIGHKIVTFRVMCILIILALMATFGIYYISTIIYQNGYDQAKGSSNSTTSVSQQLDQNAETILQ